MRTDNYMANKGTRLVQLQHMKGQTLYSEIMFL